MTNIKKLILVFNTKSMDGYRIRDGKEYIADVYGGKDPGLYAALFKTSPKLLEKLIELHQGHCEKSSSKLWCSVCDLISEAKGLNYG